MEKLCAYSEISNVEELMSCFRHFKNYCEGEKACGFTAIKAIVEFQYATKRVLANCEYSEEVVEEIKSILDLAGHRFSHCESVMEMISDSLNVLEEF